MPKPNPSLAIAEIRATLAGRSSQYPIALMGLNVRQLHFFENALTGKFERRWVAGGNDPDRGIFPLEQARADMIELQHAGNSRELVVWSFLTEEEYAAEVAKVAAEKAQQEAQEVRRLAALEEAKQRAEQADEDLRRLSRPDAVLPDEAPKKKAKAEKFVAELSKIAGGGE